ncbi:MAG: SET domain-containing protein-lysine N-methyltransferase [Candidatus Thiodiazotropha sp.]
MYKIEENIYAKDTGVYGISLFAKRDFKKGEIVFIAFGPIVTEPTLYTIPVSYNKTAPGHLLFIDPQVPDGNLSQYICHSCEPNMSIKNRTLFVAMRDIIKDVEVTIDYAMIVPAFECPTGGEVAWEGRKCLCGRPICRRTVQDYSELSTRKKNEYDGYISDFITEN